MDPLTLVRFTRLIRQRDIQVVHAHNTTASLLGSLAARWTRVPSVVTVHGLIDVTCFRYATRLIAVSEAVRRHLLARGIPDARINVVRHGVELPPLLPPADAATVVAADLDRGARYVGVFGRLAPEKGQDVAIRAWPMVRIDAPNARLLIAGTGVTRQELVELAHTLGVADAVIFRGFVPDLSPLFAACSLALVPSRREALGLAALEAMAGGRAVVASDIGGLVEVVKPGVTGALVPPDDPAALARAVTTFLADNQMVLRFGAAGRAQVAKEFRFADEVEAIRGVFREVVNSQK